ncbi:hypothetical protein CBOM_03515 [Ceraceosorus bombacis]|uniref:Uncharacterized protein n=1 Tax=Ceraceosorus bombacis TaxID=401625 RepID=A0A0P1BG01_9BASI|nr:hypothetical protein CBOM_03515 [Ceraceosorus bombacis]
MAVPLITDKAKIGVPDHMAKANVDWHVHRPVYLGKVFATNNGAVALSSVGAVTTVLFVSQDMVKQVVEAVKGVNVWGKSATAQHSMIPT